MTAKVTYATFAGFQVECSSCGASILVPGNDITRARTVAAHHECPELVCRCSYPHGPHTLTCPLVGR